MGHFANNFGNNFARPSYFTVEDRERLKVALKGNKSRIVSKGIVSEVVSG